MPNYETYVGTVRPRRGTRWSVKRSEESVLLFLMVTYYVGLLTGSILQCGEGRLAKFLTLFAQNYGHTVLNTDPFTCFRGLFLSFFLVLTALFVLSLCSVGAPFILLIPFLKGIQVGAFTSYLYTTLQLKGLFANILLLWPHQVICAGITIVFALFALQSSLRLFEVTLGRRTPKEISAPTILLKPYLICCGLNFLPVFYELMANFLFLPIFIS